MSGMYDVDRVVCVRDVWFRNSDNSAGAAVPHPGVRAVQHRRTSGESIRCIRTDGPELADRRCNHRYAGPYSVSLFMRKVVQSTVLLLELSN